jgi:hypothetical protein
MDIQVDATGWMDWCGRNSSVHGDFGVAEMDPALFASYHDIEFLLSVMSTPANTNVDATMDSNVGPAPALPPVLPSSSSTEVDEVATTQSRLASVEIVEEKESGSSKKDEYVKVEPCDRCARSGKECWMPPVGSKAKKCRSCQGSKLSCSLFGSFLLL